MAQHSNKPSLHDRLRVKRYSEIYCTKALYGKSIPHSLGLPLNQFCIVSGIRYNPGFGEELRGLLPIFTRALNARQIMSNIIPEIEALDDAPYCIWHPETASEETYRELARRYPVMSYQVGRACAVAGYTTLYRELALKPDVHIAEEARECGNLAIYDFIMSQPVRYSIMDDYTRSVDPSGDHRQPADLNGDTAAYWTLDIKQRFQNARDDRFNYGEGLGGHGYEEVVFNITEDMNIDDHDSCGIVSRSLATDPRRCDLQLLHEPLPRDLPTVQKDLLIQMAAYTGNIDRYARLRRPTPIYGEVKCCVRGIYHSPLFAVWMSKDKRYTRYISVKKAINARMIMSNVLDRAPFDRNSLPYLIWRPQVAKETSYRHLSKIQPGMHPQILRACIFAGYKDLFNELLPRMTPDLAIVGEAQNQGDTHFHEAVARRIEHLDITPEEPEYEWALSLNENFFRSQRE